MNFITDSSVESSNCTLRSTSVVIPIKDKISPTIHVDSHISEIETKKPSYLSLACTVNGYSNITNYDSKHRENFRSNLPRSREISPIRPQDYVTESQTAESKYLSPNYNKLIVSPPTMEKDMVKTSYSFMSTRSYINKETKSFVKNMLHEDSVDACIDSRTNGKFASYETSRITHYSNVNKHQEKSYSETQEYSTQNGQSSRKSFIQQRVERLYGPAALAQGFFITNRMKSRNSESEYSVPIQQQNGSSIEIDTNLKQSCSSPSLPVLRHLRPEFRAQLPILSPKRVNIENSMQKSTTVPSSLTTVTNGVEKPLINGSKSVESIENKENIQKQIILEDSKKEPEVFVRKTDKIIEDIPAAPQVILPISKAEPSENGVKTNGQLNEVRDGHYFLKTLKNETDRLIKLAEVVEEEMESQKTEIPDEILGYLRSASGKARLLVSQKMQQFEGKSHIFFYDKKIRSILV